MDPLFNFLLLLSDAIAHDAYIHVVYIIA